MKKIVIGMSTFACLFADQMPSQETSSPWFGFGEVGYAWTINTGTHNPEPSFWDDAAQGYNTNLGQTSFVTVGFGRYFWHELFGVSFLYGQLGTLHYQRYQTGSSAAPGFTGNSRTRFFDVDHQHALIRLTLDPQQYFSYTCCGITITPVGGVGLGVGMNNVSNFHTVGYNATATAGSTTSIGGLVEHTSFSWEGFLALQFQPENSHVGLKIGYDYVDGGKFQCPGSVVLNTSDGQGTYASGSPWTGHVKAHELVFSLDIRG